MMVIKAGLSMERRIKAAYSMLGYLSYTTIAYSND